MAYDVPDNETDRVRHLHDLRLVGSPQSPEFDAVVRLAAQIFDCPIALVSLVDKNEQWFKARCGIDAQGTSREVAFCTHAILQHDLFVVPDARADERFCNNPLVTGAPHIRFYAGCPLSIDGRHALGTLCVIHTEPVHPTDAQKAALRNLGTVVEGLIRAHGSAIEAEAAMHRARSSDVKLRRHADLLEQIADLSGVGGWELDIDSQELTWTAQTRVIHEVPPDFEPVLDKAIEFYAPEARQEILDAVEHGMATGGGWDLELPFITAKGRHTWVRAVGRPLYDGDRLVRLVGAIQDVSRRRETERQAREKADELEVTLANMNQGVSVFDADARLILWNRQYVTVFEKPEGEVFDGVRFSDLLDAEKARGEIDADVADTVSYLQARLSEGETVRSRFTLNSGRIVASTHAPMPGGGWVGTHEDITQRERAAEHIPHAADHDTLTGLPNRSRFNAEIDMLMRMATQSGQAGALLLADLDRFKDVNDTCGHAVGDGLLKAVARRLQAAVRPEDFVARLGGDEFAVILAAGSGKDEARFVAARIVEEIAKPFSIEGVRVEIGASVGIAFTWQAEGLVDRLLTHADGALYKAKHAGRGGFRLFDEDLEAEERDRRRLEHGLRRAVAEKAFALHYQPVLTVDGQTLIGYEALLRWQDADGADVPPSVFLPIIEEIGLIDELGAFVIEEGIACAAAWPTSDRLFLNIASRQLSDDRFPDFVRAVLDRSAMPASRLELEVTENILVDNDCGKLEALRRLKDMGVTIALDDFGTGYSSLNCLQQFPFDRLKIDRVFVADFERNRQSAAIVSSVANLANGLGIASTAEGVEIPDQAILLALAGVTNVQGFHFGRPMPAEAIAEHRRQFDDAASRGALAG